MTEKLEFGSKEHIRRLRAINQPAIRRSSDEVAHLNQRIENLEKALTELWFLAWSKDYHGRMRASDCAAELLGLDYKVTRV